MAAAEELRAAIRRLPVGVAVLTAAVDGDRIGMTVASLVSLSLEPPLVGVSIGRQLAAHELVRHAGGYAISILGADQEQLAHRFARRLPPIALWDSLATREGPVGPLLADAVAWLECRLVAEHAVGDHTLFVGAVESATLGTDSGGLAYRGGSYHAVG